MRFLAGTNACLNQASATGISLAGGRMDVTFRSRAVFVIFSLRYK